MRWTWGVSCCAACLLVVSAALASAEEVSPAMLEKLPPEVLEEKADREMGSRLKNAAQSAFRLMGED